MFTGDLGTGVYSDAWKDLAQERNFETGRREMSVLSKKHWRFLGYVILIVALRVLVLNSFTSSTDSVAESRRKLVNPSQQSADEVGDKSKQIVVNLGKLSCLHLGSLWTYCYDATEESKVNIPFVERRIVKKDLKASIGFRWFGSCEFFFYDTLDLKSVSLLSEEMIENTNMITSVQGTGGVKVLDNLYVSLVPLSISSVNQGESVLSEMNVLFGEDCVEPRANWHLDKSWKLSDARYPGYLTYRFLNLEKSKEKKQGLNVKEDGTFKIVQLADLHFATGKNECRDEYPKHADCDADSKTVEFIEKVLDIESPDLVVYTGDQIMGDQSVQDSETTLLKALAPVIERKIPWAMIWGNHDDEGSLDRWELSEIASTLPYSMFHIGPKDTKDNSFGVGNYVHQVFDLDNNNALITLYFLDSHKYSTTGKVYPGYDWIKEAQWEYLRQVYDQNVARSNPETIETQLSMAFFHIPLPEYLNLDSQKVPGARNPFVGSFKEGVTAPKYNSGGISTLDYLGVDLTSCGHDHCNDYCLLDDSTSRKIWLCFGGGAGEGGYAGYGGTERRIRTFEFDTKEGNILTWKRLNGSPTETFDYQAVVKDGVPNVE